MGGGDLCDSNCCSSALFLQVARYSLRAATTCGSSCARVHCSQAGSPETRLRCSGVVSSPVSSVARPLFSTAASAALFIRPFGGTDETHPTGPRPTPRLGLATVLPRQRWICPQRRRAFGDWLNIASRRMLALPPTAGGMASAISARQPVRAASRVAPPALGARQRI